MKEKQKQLITINICILSRVFFVFGLLCGLSSYESYKNTYNGIFIITGMSSTIISYKALECILKYNLKTLIYKYQNDNNNNNKCRIKKQ